MESQKEPSSVISYNNEPSTLTPAQLFREIGSLKELLMVRIMAVEHGIVVAHEDMVRLPTDIQQEVGRAKDYLTAKIKGNKKFFLAKLEGEHQLKEEKFKKVDQRFELLEQARQEQKKDTSDAVEKAFKAAKDAVIEQNNSNQLAINKSEVALTKQIDQQALVIQQINKSLDEKINDLKERMIRVEGNVSGIGSMKSDLAVLHTTSTKGEGKDEGKAVQRANIISGISIAITILTILFTAFKALNK